MNITEILKLERLIADEKDTINKLKELKKDLDRQIKSHSKNIKKYNSELNNFYDNLL